MKRVLVHAGFYKTGTTSLQDFLSRNRAALAPHFTYLGPEDLRDATARARDYARWPTPLRRARFRRALGATLADPALNAAPALVLSRENFIGLMPGHRDWRRRPAIGFPHAAQLLGVVTDALTGRFPGAGIEFLFTTRDRGPWLGSIHGHLLRSINLTDDLDQFTARFPSGFSCASEITRLTAALSPHPVHQADLATLSQRPEGPAAAILDLLAVPDTLRRTLAPTAPANPGQSPAQRAAFLDLNRRRLSPADLKTAKQSLMDDQNDA